MTSLWNKHNSYIQSKKKDILEKSYFSPRHSWFITAKVESYSFSLWQSNNITLCKSWNVSFSFFLHLDFSVNCQRDLDANQLQAWKWLYFYWLQHGPEDISCVGNVLNIISPQSRSKKDKLVQTPDCCAPTIFLNVIILVCVCCCSGQWADWRPVQLAES